MSNIQEITAKIKYATYGINCLGLIGSAISIVVFSRRRFAMKPIGVYCKCIAIFDLFIVVNFLVNITELILNHSIFDRYNFVCKFVTFISTAISPMPGYILAVFSLDQFISASNINIKHRFSFTRTKRFQYALISAIFLVHCLIYSPVFVLVSVRNESSILVCKAENNVLPIMLLVESSLLPFSVIITTTSLIVKRLVYAKRVMYRLRLIDSNRRFQINNYRIIKYVFNSVIVNVICMFLFFTTPLFFSCLLPRVNFATSSLIDSICFFLFNLNFSLHFFVYLSFNSNFKCEFFLLIRSKCRFFY